jgi:hypothetical protein
MALGADQTNQTNNLVFIKHHHQLHIGKNVSDEVSILAQSRMALGHSHCFAWISWTSSVQE